MVLGLIGIGQVPSLNHPGFDDRLYDAINLFRLGGAASLTATPSPVLRVARWLAPLTLAFAGFWAANSLLTEQFTNMRVRWSYRNHLIVCGLGTFGRLMAESFDARGMQVVAVERDPAGYNVSWCRAAGIPLIHGDATDSKVLERAGIARARRVIAVCGSDGVNADVAIHVRDHRRPRRRPIDCYVHLDDADLCALLEEDTRSLGRSAVTIHFLNVNRSGPLALLQNYSEVLDPTAPGAPRVVVVGSDPLGLSLVVGAAREWWFDMQAAGAGGAPLGAGPESLPRMSLTLVSSDAEERCTQLLSRYPRLGEACDLQPCPVDLADHESSTPQIAISAETDRVTAFVCLADESDCLAAALRLRRAMPLSVSIVACILGRSGSVTGIDVVSDQLRLRAISTFPLIRRVCDPEFVLNDLTETIAQTLHSNYVANRRRDGTYDPDLQESHRDWDRLPETYREANRAQARFATERLATIGCEVRPTEDWEVGQPVFKPEEIEAMAETEHERWCADRTADGWTYGKVRDNIQLRHPDLVPWSQLDESTREKDREAVRELPTVLAREGLAIVRSEAPPA